MTRRRLAVPWTCAIVNAVALAAMAVLAPGTQAGGDAVARIDYIERHRSLWVAGWSIWIAAACTLLAFYIWWAHHLPAARMALAAVAVAAVGMAFDVSAELIYITRLPDSITTVGAEATFMTGVIANGLYSVAGIALTLLTPQLSRRLAGAAVVMWGTGLALSILVALHLFVAAGAATVVLFVIFCPWIVVMARRLP